MNFDFLSPDGRRALVTAQRLAGARDQAEVDLEHLLLALASLPTTEAMLRRAGADVPKLAAALDAAVAPLPRQPGEKVYLSANVLRLLDLSQVEARERGRTQVEPEDLLLGIPLETSSPAARALREAGATLPRLEAAAVAHARPPARPEGRSGRRPEPTAETAPSAPSAASTWSGGSSAAPGEDALGRYTRDLTALAAAHKLDPVIGRSDEIRRLMQILGRRTKNNPIVVGEPGVGKTAVVEGLAHRIAIGDVPLGLRGKRIVALDIGALIAGAKFRGEFEERMRAVIGAIAATAGAVLLFVEEIHTLMGAGRGEGSIDAASLLKPALARGEISIIGATTPEEFRLHIEKDPAFERRFQPVQVDEPTDAECLLMLRGLKLRYEERHRLRILDPALVAAVTLARRYVTERFLPDKAIDLIDESASRLRLELDSQPDEIDELERRHASLRMELDALRRDQDPDSAGRRAAIEAELAKLGAELDPMRDKWQAELAAIAALRDATLALEDATERADEAERRGDLAVASEARFGRVPAMARAVGEAEAKLRTAQGGSRLLEDAVEPMHVARVVADWTKIPVARMLEEERQKVLGIAQKLRQRVVGQDDAINLVAAAVKRARAGLQDGGRPIGSFLFMGPTGVGKTELAKALAEFLFDDEKAMVRLDMSEYMEKHAVARLTGAPPGYVGYEEGGQLTEAVRRRPYAVVLFDEVEKAHPDVFNVLLALLDDGRLTDAQGRTVGFENVVLIMTSNLGSQAILASVESGDRAGMEREVKAALRAHFRPEFLNRVDETVIFNPLGKDDVARIVDLQVKRFARLLGEQKVALDLSPQARDLLAEESYDPAFGARPVKRCVQRRLRDPLAEKLLRGELPAGCTVRVERREHELVFAAAPTVS